MLILYNKEAAVAVVSGCFFVVFLPESAPASYPATAEIPGVCAGRFLREARRVLAAAVAVYAKLLP